MQTTQSTSAVTATTSGEKTDSTTKADAPVTVSHTDNTLAGPLPIKDPVGTESPTVNEENRIDLVKATEYVREHQAQILAEKYADADVSIGIDTPFFVLDVGRETKVDVRTAVFPILWRGTLVDVIQIWYSVSDDTYIPSYTPNEVNWTQAGKILAEHAGENFLICSVESKYVLISEKNELTCISRSAQDVTSFFSLTDSYYQVFDNDLTRISAASLELK